LGLDIAFVCATSSFGALGGLPPFVHLLVEVGPGGCHAGVELGRGGPGFRRGGLGGLHGRSDRRFALAHHADERFEQHAIEDDREQDDRDDDEDDGQIRKHACVSTACRFRYAKTQILHGISRFALAWTRDSCTATSRPQDKTGRSGLRRADPRTRPMSVSSQNAARAETTWGVWGRVRPTAP
jgi:hypothetical protein